MLRAVVPRGMREETARELGVSKAALDSYASRGKHRKARLPAVLVAPLSEFLHDDRLIFAVAGPRVEALARLGLALVELGRVDSEAQHLVQRLQRNGRRRRKKGRG